MKGTKVMRALYHNSKAFKEGVKAGQKEMIEKLRELKYGYENDLDAAPSVREIHIQLCAKISLIEKLILELKEE